MPWGHQDNDRRGSVLDEGHEIKNHNSSTFKSACEIEADHKWIVTGTPFMDSMDEAFAYLNFLRVDIPKQIGQFYKTFPLHEPAGREKLGAILSEIYLTRGKQSRLFGRPLMAMKKMSVSIIEV